MKKVWRCEIGEADSEDLPMGSDFLMRVAVKQAYFKLTGKHPEFTASGWGPAPVIRKSIWPESDL
jgi:hypothetical protein